MYQAFYDRFRHKKRHDEIAFSSQNRPISTNRRQPIEKHINRKDHTQQNSCNNIYLNTTRIPQTTHTRHTNKKRT